MESTLLSNVDIDYYNVCQLHKNNENTSHSTQTKHRSTVVKYTKLPDYESDVRGTYRRACTDNWFWEDYCPAPKESHNQCMNALTVSWPQQKYSRLRLFTTLNGNDTRTSRSLKSDIMFRKEMTSILPKRKIATITEDNENNLHPKFSKEKKRLSSTTKTSNRSVATDNIEEKQASKRNTSRFSMSSEYANKTNARTKLNNSQITQDINVSKPLNSRKYSKGSREKLDHGQLNNNKDNGVIRNFNNSNIPKSSVSKNLKTSTNEREISLNKKNVLKDVKCNISPTKSIDKSKSNKPISHFVKSKETFLKEIQTNNKPVTVIRVPLEESFDKINLDTEENKNFKLKNITTCNLYEIENYKHVNIGTEPRPTTVDQVTETNDFEKKHLKSTYIQTEFSKGSLDNLEIPNVTLIKDKPNIQKKERKVVNNSLPSNQLPTVIMSSDKNDYDKIGISFCTSYIISRATLTYTTQSKINFHVVESKDNTSTFRTPSLLNYPKNVVSVFKNEMKRNKHSKNNTAVDNVSNKWNETKTGGDSTKCVNELKSFNSSYGLNKSKLMKPSDIIRTIKVKTGFMQSEYICDQFQRELNFIDSFFESLQYLENSSLASKCFTSEKVDSIAYSPEIFKNILEDKGTEYDSFVTKLDNDSNMDDIETMTSKNLCLLNSLIRDEQRRAKNLLFVLKMREDALKEFATSQILWLENKKKHDNIDISVLKKKQRGALLKLQHECGEMQRMRKALLTLSEKRKVALMKTKKSLELKLKNNVDVDQIVLGKKKLKKSISADRNIAPLKCFDLSSSGCEESSTSRHNSETALTNAGIPRPVKSVEKSIQTAILVDKSTETAAENFIVVDGGYLNILFNNLLLPQIFSGGKQYEVNEDALKNIVDSSNSQNNDNNIIKEDIVEKLIDGGRNSNRNSSSSPSTGRSLIEEFDQYYRGLDGEKSSADSSDNDFTSPAVVYEIKDSSVQVSKSMDEQFENRLYQSASTMTNDSDIVSGSNVFATGQSCMCEALDLANSYVMHDYVVPNQTGPLTVPVGAAATNIDISGAAGIVRPTLKTISTSTISESSDDSESMCPTVHALSLASPVHCEAEELRRQQLAIEREIKALEQQQCQLLVVREIPDKPPPPYTPPVDSRITKPSSVFLMDVNTADKIKKLIVDPSNTDLDEFNSFDMFLKDFCNESHERYSLEKSEEPWDACNLLPQKRQYDIEKIAQRTSSELAEVLEGVTPTVVSGVGARRSDHIDDILFAEWRRCEPEWTSLHTDEAIVKNQIFDCIFQKLLTETVDEYKKIISDNKTTES